MSAPALTLPEIFEGPPDPDRVAQLEQQLLTLPQRQLETTHVIHGGMCARTIFIPAGTLLTGALTNHDNLCIVDGDITVTTDEGPQRLIGHHVLPATAGYKRVGLANTDTWWTMVWPTQLTDLDAIEKDLTDEADQLQTRRALPDVTADYHAALAEFGMTDEQIQGEVQADNVIEPTSLPFWMDRKPSLIHGLGMFAAVELPPGFNIGPARHGDKRTWLGRYVNHSPDPAVRPVRTSEGMDFVTCRNVAHGDEITVDYRETLQLAIQIQLEQRTCQQLFQPSP